MKITFLVPTLDTGKDGIADYTLRFAEQCRDLGHETQSIVLGRNNWITQQRKLKVRLASAKAEIIEFSPDVLSWQFDGRIFHPLSIFPRWVIPDFSNLCGRVHLMAHETWEGDEVDARLRRRIKGVIQKHSFKQTLGVITPDVIHTTNLVYLEHLRSLGFPARMLPLFSSFPIAPDSTTRTDYEGNVWEFVFFGGFRDNWNPSEFVLKLKSIGRRIIIHHVGHHHSPDILKSLRDTCQGWATFIEHGPQPGERVSEIFLNCHFAVSTYNLLLLGKSSVYAAFVDHGLPVIVPRDDDSMTRSGLVSGIPASVILPKDLRKSLQCQRRMAVRDSLKATVEQFLQDLGAMSSQR